jgi:hypothetical protein
MSGNTFGIPGLGSGTANAALASVLGALNDAAAADDPTSADTAMQYLKQIVNNLQGSAGIAAWPGEAAPANGVSIAEVLEAIHADVTGLNGSAMAGTNSAALASVVGALNDAAAAGEVTTADTLVQYVKQLINILIGTAGIVAFPAEALPADAVSVAEVLRYIADSSIRNQNMGGLVTAIVGQGPVAVNEQWHHTTIDTTNLWSISLSGTGGTTNQASIEGLVVARLNCPAVGDDASLGCQRYVPNPKASTAVRHVTQKTVLEFEMLFGTVANVDNALFIVMLGTSNFNPSRADNNTMGFIMVSDALNALTDSGGSETLTVIGSPPTLTEMNKYRIEVTNGQVEFFVNEVSRATHTANIHTDRLGFGARMAAEGGTGATKLELGHIRHYTLDA